MLRESAFSREFWAKYTRRIVANGTKEADQAALEGVSALASEAHEQKDAIWLSMPGEKKRTPDGDDDQGGATGGAPPRKGTASKVAWLAARRLDDEEHREEYQQQLQALEKAGAPDVALTCSLLRRMSKVLGTQNAEQPLIAGLGVQQQGGEGQEEAPA
jgi:hypothetical protein